MCIGLKNDVSGQLNYTYCSAYGGYTKEAQLEGYSILLAKLERKYPNVFAEVSCPITANRTTSTIPLLNPYLPPKHRELYPLS